MECGKLIDIVSADSIDFPLETGVNAICIVELLLQNSSICNLDLAALIKSKHKTLKLAINKKTSEVYLTQNLNTQEVIGGLTDFLVAKLRQLQP